MLIALVLIEQLAKECCIFFATFQFCILHHMYTPLLQNNWLAHVLASLHFGIRCAFTWLPYFLQRVCALLYYFFCTKLLILHLIDVVQILVGLPSSSSVLFFTICLRFRSSVRFAYFSLRSVFSLCALIALYYHFCYFVVTIYLCNLLCWLTCFACFFWCFILQPRLLACFFIA